jgi:hypothetical protein
LLLLALFDDNGMMGDAIPDNESRRDDERVIRPYDVHGVTNDELDVSGAIGNATLLAAPLPAPEPLILLLLLLMLLLPPLPVR